MLAYVRSGPGQFHIKGKDSENRVSVTLTTFFLPSNLVSEGYESGQTSEIKKQCYSISWELPDGAHAILCFLFTNVTE